MCMGQLRIQWSDMHSQEKLKQTPCALDITSFCLASRRAASFSFSSWIATSSLSLLRPSSNRFWISCLISSEFNLSSTFFRIASSTLLAVSSSMSFNSASCWRLENKRNVKQENDGTHSGKYAATFHYRYLSKTKQQYKKSSWHVMFSFFSFFISPSFLMHYVTIINGQTNLHDDKALKICYAFKAYL